MPNKQTLQQFGASIKAKYPEYKDMDDAAVGKAVIAKYPQYNDMVNDTPTATPSAMSQIGSTLSDLGKGAVKGGLNTVNGVSEMMHKLPFGIGEALVPQSGLTAAQMYAKPSNLTQSIGKGAEQAGEFLLPGMGEEAAGAKLLEHAPQLGRMAAPIARAGMQTLGSAAINKAQGGSATTGALMGAGGAAVGEGMRAAAPLLAESAWGVRGADKIRGRTVGQVAHLVYADPSDYPQTLGTLLRDGQRSWYELDYEASDGTEAVYRFIGHGEAFPRTAD